MVLLAPAVCLAALAAAAPSPVRLQALTATSGSDAAALLDGKVETGWRPEGDALGEGVLLRFEARTRISAIELASCGGNFSVDLFVNGRSGGARVTPTPKGTLVPLGNATVHSVFVKVATASAPPCLGEIRFQDGAETLPVLPPRRVAGRVEATSTLAPAAAYHPSYLFDSRIDFGWAEGSKGTGEGEAITVELEAPLELVALELWNGYQRSPVHFEKNARARRVTLTLDDGAPARFELKDAMGAQKLTLPAPVRARRIRLSIDTVYRGSKYPDMVLSELRLWDAAGPVGVAVTDREAMRAALLAELKGSSLAPLLGRHLTNGCTGDGDDYRRTLKLRPDQTFVVYEASSDPTGGESASEVFDGTWVPTGRDGPWTEVELFGRRHRVDERWDPYAERPKSVKESDRIAGGRLRIAVVGDLPDGERASVLAPSGSAPPIGACLEPSGDALHAGVVVRGPQLTDLFVVRGR